MLEETDLEVNSDYLENLDTSKLNTADELMRFFCIDICKLFLDTHGSLKKDTKDNYALVINDINFYKMYTYDTEKCVEKNDKVCEMIVNIMRYICNKKGFSFTITYVYKLDVLSIYYYQKE